MTAVRYDLEAPPEKIVDDLEQAARAMQRTADEADDLSNSMELLSIPARKVGAATKEAASGAKVAKDAFDGASQAAAALGGKAAGAAGLLKGLVDGALKTGSALGPIGLAATGAAAGIGALTFGVYKGIEGLLSFGRAAVDVREDIEGFADDGIMEGLDELARKFESLDLQTQILKGTIGSELLPVIGGLVDELTGVAKVAEDVVIALGKIQPPDNLALRAALALATSGSSEFARLFADIGQQTAQQLDGSLAQVLGNWEKVKPVLDDWKAGVSKVNAEYAALEREAEAADKAALAEITRRLSVGEQVTAAMDAARAKQKAADQAYGEWRFRSWKSTLDKQLTELDAYIAVAIRKNEEETAAFEAELEKRAALHDSIFGAIVNQAGAMMTQTWGAMFEELRDTTARAVFDIEALISESNEKIAEWRRQDTDESNRLADQEVENLADLEDEKKRLMAEAFRQEQVLKAGQAAMAGALAIVQAYAQLGPIVATVMTPAIVGMTLMQIETIQGQSPPPMHDGGVMGADEFMIGNQMVRAGESAVVFSQRTTETGGAARAMEMNRDQDMPRESRLVMTDANRVVGELVAKEMGRRGSPIAAFGKPGFSDPYARR